MLNSIKTTCIIFNYYYIIILLIMNFNNIIGSKSSVLFSAHDSVSEEQRKDFFHVIELAKKSDHQIYTQEKLNRLGFHSGSNSTGITNIVSSPIAIGTTLYNWISSRFKHLTFDRAEGLTMIFSHLASFIHAVGEVMEYAYTATKETLGKTIATIAGFVFFPIEIAYHSFMTYTTHDMKSNLEPELIKFVMNFASQKPRSKKELLQDIQDLKVHIESLEEPIKSFCGERCYKELIININRILKKSKFYSNLRVEKLKNETVTALSLYAKNYISKSFKKIDKNYLMLSKKQIKHIDKFAKEALKNEPYNAALERTLSKIQDSHLDNKAKLSRILRPWLVAKYTKEHDDILKLISSEDISEKLEGTHKALDLLSAIKTNLDLKEKLHITSIIINTFLLTMLVFSFVGMPILSPFIISGIALTWFLMDSALSKGYLDSPDGEFHISNVIPKWVKFLYGCGEYAVKKIKEAGLNMQKQVSLYFGSSFKDREIVNLRIPR